MQIKLATGSVSIVGAFERNDTLQDVYNFLSTVSTYVKCGAAVHQTCY